MTMNINNMPCSCESEILEAAKRRGCIDSESSIISCNIEGGTSTSSLKPSPDEVLRFLGPLQKQPEPVEGGALRTSDEIEMVDDAIRRTREALCRLQAASMGRTIKRQPNTASVRSMPSSDKLSNSAASKGRRTMHISANQRTTDGSTKFPKSSSLPSSLNQARSNGVKIVMKPNKSFSSRSDQERYFQSARRQRSERFLASSVRRRESDGGIQYHFAPNTSTS